MKFHILKCIFFLMISLFLVSNCAGVSVGSSKIMSRQGSVRFPTGSNEILSFTKIGSGFSLVDSGTTVILKTVFPVTGIVQLNRGVLDLRNDLVFDNVSTFINLGNITGNNHAVELSRGMSVLGTESDNTLYTFENVFVFLNSNIDYEAKIRWDGNCVINGGGHVLDLVGTASIIVGSNATLTIQDIKLENVGGTNIHCADNTGKIVLDNVNWCQKGSDYNFDTGAIQFKNKVKMHGKTVFAYQSSQASTILANASLKLDSGFTFSYDPNSTSQDLIAFIDETSKLILNSATLHTTGTGMSLTKGNLVVQGESQLVSEKDGVTDRGITFGDGTASGDLTVKIDAGSKLTVSQGSLNYKNTSDIWTMINDLSVLVMSANTTLRLYESLTINNGLVRFGDNTALKRASGKTINGLVDVAGVLAFQNL